MFRFFWGSKGRNMAHGTDQANFVEGRKNLDIFFYWTLRSVWSSFRERHFFWLSFLHRIYPSLRISLLFVCMHSRKDSWKQANMKQKKHDNHHILCRTTRVGIHSILESFSIDPLRNTPKHLMLKSTKHYSPDRVRFEQTLQPSERGNNQNSSDLCCTPKPLAPLKGIYS